MHGTFSPMARVCTADASTVSSRAAARLRGVVSPPHAPSQPPRVLFSPIVLTIINQERIFAADDAKDYLNDCALSGEPLIATMSPETDAHEYALDEPFARTIVGERRHLSAYEVRLLPRPCLDPRPRIR